MKIEDDIRGKVEKFLSSPEKNMNHALGIHFITMTRDEVSATMLVSENSVQPMRILHGGASVALAETVMSVGAWLNIDDVSKTAVGIEINANHLRPVSEGSSVTCTGKPVHRGSKTQVWEARISTDSGKLASISRCTLAIVNRQTDSGDHG